MVYRGATIVNAKNLNTGIKLAQGYYLVSGSEDFSQSIYRGNSILITKPDKKVANHFAACLVRKTVT